MQGRGWNGEPRPRTCRPACPLPAHPSRRLPLAALGGATQGFLLLPVGRIQRCRGSGGWPGSRPGDVGAARLPTSPLPPPPSRGAAQEPVVSRGICLRTTHEKPGKTAQASRQRPILLNRHAACTAAASPALDSCAHPEGLLRNSASLSIQARRRSRTAPPCLWAEGGGLFPHHFRSCVVPIMREQATLVGVGDADNED